MTARNQCASTVWMVRPAIFASNTETSATNHFQQTQALSDSESIYMAALHEFDRAVDVLRKNGVEVIVSQSKDHTACDAIFPNNWISFHHDASVLLYPMMADSRRRERNISLTGEIESKFVIKKTTDLSSFENDHIFLEGTGSMVFDHKNTIAYAALSKRTAAEILDHILPAYKKCIFNTADENGFPVYHTNVLLHIGEKYCVICADIIPDPAERKMVCDLLIATGHEIIYISEFQLMHFAGNMLQLKTYTGEVLTVLSQSAYNVLTADQVQTLNRLTKLIVIELGTIEKFGGGSIRCMLTEIFLPRKTDANIF